MSRIGPYLLGPNNTSENGIYTGDSRELAKLIPDESIDLCFTDPIYQNVDDYRWLAETAARVLKPDGALLVWSNGKWHYRHTRSIDDLGVLTYRWTFAVVNGDTNAPMDGKIISKTNRVIWFNRGLRRHMRDYLPDGYLSIGGRWDIPKSKHQWGKSNRFTARCVRTFSDEHSVIADFFTGGGTVPAVCKMLSRHCLAFEIDPATAELARERVRQTQPPLPGLVLETQAALELGG